VYQYSTGGRWDEPHYEKIMQFQAENLRAYAMGYAHYKDAKYLSAAKAIDLFLNTFLRSPEGAFYTSMDADLVQGEHSESYFKLDDAGAASSASRASTSTFTRARRLGDLGLGAAVRGHRRAAGISTMPSSGEVDRRASVDQRWGWRRLPP